MWPILSAFMLFDAGREFRHRLGTVVLYSGLGLIVVVAILFALQGAQLGLAGVMSPPLASLVVAGSLLILAAFVLLMIRLRQQRSRATGEIAKVMLGTVPLASSVMQSGNARAVIAALVLVGAAVLGSRLGRKS